MMTLSQIYKKVHYLSDMNQEALLVAQDPSRAFPITWENRESGTCAQTFKL